MGYDIVILPLFSHVFDEVRYGVVWLFPLNVHHALR